MLVCRPVSTQASEADRARPGETIEAIGLVADGDGAEPVLRPLLVDPPGPGEVRVRMLASGICHTDLLVVRGRAWWPDYPYVLGHEGLGRIESVGPGVDAGLTGATVLLAWKAPCGACRACRRGRSWLCVTPPGARGRLRSADGAVMAPSLRVGSHATYAVVPAAAAIELPSELDPALGCVIGCAVLTGFGAVRNTAAAAAGDRVVVFGCGGVGLSVVMAARVSGAVTIVAVDPIPARRELAQRAGASAVLDPASVDVVQQIRSLTGGHGVDHAFDAVGRGVLGDAIASLDSGGVATLVGTPDVGDEMTLDLEALYLRRTGLRVSQYGDALPARDAPAIAALHAGGRIDLGLLVSRELRLDDAVDGLRDLEAGAAVRTVLRFDLRRATLS
jgi:S-(hydroxymethyl)mycothiol dehydrogenase